MSSQLTSFARCNHDVDFIVFESRTGIIVVFKNEFTFNVQDKRSGWILCWRRSNYCPQKRRTAKNHRCRWCIHKDYSMSNNNRISFLSLAYRDFKTPITSSCWIIQNTSLSIFVTLVLPETVLSLLIKMDGHDENIHSSARYLWLQIANFLIIISLCPVITSTDVEKPPESSVAVTTSEYTCGWRKSSKSSSLANFTIPDVGPMLNVPAPWPCAFNVYRISRSANDLAFTEMILQERRGKLVAAKHPHKSFG